MGLHLEEETTMQLVVLFVVSFMLLLIVSTRGRRKLPFPPGPRPLPIIGNMNMMDQLTHRGLARLARQYGGLCYMRLGFLHAFAVSTPEMARQVLQVQDNHFSNRPATIAIAYLTYDRSDMAFAHNGPFWRQMRKLCVIKLFSRKRAESWASVRDEVDSAVRAAAASTGSPVNLGDLAFNLTKNITFRAAFGAASGEGQSEFIAILQEFSKLFGAFNIGDFIPWLKRVDLQGINRRLKTARRSLDVFIDKIIDEHMTCPKEADAADADMVDEMLAFLGNDGKSGGDADELRLTRDNIKAIIMDVMFGGTETVASAIEWTLAPNQNEHQRRGHHQRRRRRTKSRNFNAMDYERIHRPSTHQQSGGISPSKLRAILLGIEKKQKEVVEEDLDSGIALRSDAAADAERRGANASQSSKDEDMVRLPPECSPSVEFVSGYRSRDHNLASSRIRDQEDDSIESDSVSSSVFEFHKTAGRVPPRSPLMPPFSKPAPSKWDDAQKWIASPTSNRTSKRGGGLQQKKLSLGGCGNKSFGSKVVCEVPDQVDTKRIDTSLAKKNVGWQKTANWAPEPFPTMGGDQPSSHFENPFANSAINLHKHDSSISVPTATTFIPPVSTVKSVSMRDMGTEMTPIASQEASQTGTPNGSVTHTRSPTSSRPLSPAKPGATSTETMSAEHLENYDKELSEKALRMKTRKEIMVLGQQLGKMSIAAWASKEEEGVNPTVPMDQPARSVNEARATAWEDAEKAKYLARFKQEEIKIHAWENHQKAKTEAEMRKIEVEVERIRARAHEKLMNQLADARHKAEEKRAAAEAKRNQHAAKTAKQAEDIRKSGRIPISSSCWDWFS